jgi:hypothetical protein
MAKRKKTKGQTTIYKTLQIKLKIKQHERRRGRDRMVVDLQLPVQSVPITTEVVSSSPIHDEVYSMQRNVITFISDLREVGGFPGYSGFLRQ